MDNREKIMGLAKKLKALAEQGVDGEKETAEQMLQKFMQKHCIKPEDLSDDIRKPRTFKVTDVQFKLFQQIVANVCGKISIRYDPRKKYSVHKPYFIELTDYEFVEVSAKWHFYWKAFEEQSSIFYSAFIQKNRLWRERTEEDGEEEELTPEEKEHLWKVMQMMQGISKSHFVKQLKNK